MFRQAYRYYAWPSLSLLIGAIVMTVGCAGKAVRPQDPHSIAELEELFQNICQPGSGVRSADGTVWIRAKSPEAKGTFPAEVLVSEKDGLKLEVTNLIGGTEARITIKDGSYDVFIPKEKRREKSERSDWGGIPLRWAQALFLGRLPCPTGKLERHFAWLDESKDRAAGLELNLLDKGAIRESFFFELTREEKKPWVKHMEWRHFAEKGTLLNHVRFEFSKPESKTLSPLQWSAKSDRGEVRVQWKQRNIQTR